jgi:hypothetical protein
LQLRFDVFIGKVPVIAIWWMIVPGIERLLIRFCRWVDRPQTPGGDVHLFRSNLSKHLPLVLGEEGDASIDQTVQCDTQRPHVNLLCDFRLGLTGLSVEAIGVTKLWSKERRCAYSLGELQVVIEILSLGLRHGFVGFPITYRPAKVGNPKI